MSTLTLEVTHGHDGTATVTDPATPHARFVVWQDTDAEDPRAWQDDASAQTLIYSANRGSSPDSTDDAASPVMAAFMQHYTEHGDADAALILARRYARIWSPGWKIDTYSARGYSQGDWWDLVTVTGPDAGDPSDYSQEWEQWARGDVYSVMRETFMPCETPDTCHGDEESHWWSVTDQGIESLVIGGIYADDAEDAVAQYLAMGE